MSTVPQHIPAAETVSKVQAGDREPFDVAGAHLMWKIRGEDSAYAFAVSEETLAAGEGVPVHSHVAVEAFYVLSGAADFLRFIDGAEDWIRCETGELMIVPPNALHALQNNTSEPCRLLGISTPLRQSFFDAVAAADQTTSFASLASRQAMQQIAKVGRQHYMYFAEVGSDSRAGIVSGADAGMCVVDLPWLFP